MPAAVESLIRWRAMVGEAGLNAGDNSYLSKGPAYLIESSDTRHDVVVVVMLGKRRSVWGNKHAPTSPDKAS